VPDRDIDLIPFQINQVRCGFHPNLDIRVATHKPSETMNEP
jgi:hypothetical protein